jgi:hypothetical protein
VPLDEAAGERKPEAETFMGARHRICRLGEGFQAARQRLRRNPRPVVANGDASVIVLPRDLDLDTPAGRRMRDGIGEKLL